MPRFNHSGELVAPAPQAEGHHHEKQDEHCLCEDGQLFSDPEEVTERRQHSLDSALEAPEQACHRSQTLRVGRALPSMLNHA
jgi:hypothetical protein